MMKLSFIIPVYNADKYIDRCLKSCLTFHSETFPIEIIVVDDGSNDQSACHVQEIAKKHSNIKLITQPNQGVSVARNTGIKHASGDFIMFVDADDYISTTAVPVLACLIDYIASKDIDVLSHGAIVENHDQPKADNILIPHNELDISHPQSGVEYIRENEGPYKKGFVSGAWGFIVRRKSIPSTTRFIPGLPFGEDSLFFLRLLLDSRKVAFTSLKFYHYVQHPASAMHSEHRIEKIASATLTRCIENRKLMTHPKAADQEIRDIISGRLISIAFSRLFLRILKRRNEVSYGKQAYTLFRKAGLWPLPSLPKSHSPYIGKKAFLYRMLIIPTIYSTALALRKII